MTRTGPCGRDRASLLDHVPEGAPEPDPAVGAAEAGIARLDEHARAVVVVGRSRRARDALPRPATGHASRSSAPAAGRTSGPTSSVGHCPSM